MSVAVLETPSLEAYGVSFPDTSENKKVLASPYGRERFFFQRGYLAKSYTGEGRYFHAKNLADMIWRQKGREQFVWHDDMETVLQEYCQTNEVLVTGPASYSKTFGAALYALQFWMEDPLNTGVIVCSTTLPGLKRRVWGEIRKLFLAMPPQIKGGNNMVDSLTALQSTKGDMQHGIFGIAVAEGNEQKALGRIIGFHPKRILVIVDELTDVPWSIIEALTNLFTGKEKAQFIGIGNAASIFDSHGKMCEPKDGWSSVSVNTERFETKRGGVCIHFDGFKSPNIKAGKTLFKFLLSQEDIDSTARQYGENSPQMWRFRRGWWCPEGTVKSILSETIINKFRAMDKATWEGGFVSWAGLDPSFEGGDKCVLRFAKTGKEASGIDVMELGESVTIKVDLHSKIPIHYQIAKQVKEECTLRGVDVYHFGMDVTGEGGGLASIIAEEWGPEFHQVEFGGKASDLPVSPINPKTCYEEYANKVCELWYSFRTALMGNQVKGLDADTALEFCARLYTVENKIKLESKTDMKTRLSGRSPDNADAVVVVLDTVKHRGGLGSIVSKAIRTINRAWEKLVQDFTPDDKDSFTHDSMENI